MYFFLIKKKNLFLNEIAVEMVLFLAMEVSQIVL